jgi:LacI family transcriptional regulator
MPNLCKPKVRSKRLTLADVAKASGFSSSTVSIVLNEAPLSRYVAAMTKQRIRETAKRLGYRPDVFARSLRSQRSHTIGILVIDLADPFCTLILQGIESKLMGTGYLPIIMDAQNDPNQVNRYVDLMIGRRVEGLITVANWLLFDISMIEDINDGQLPTIMVGRDLELPHIRSISVDNEAGGSAAIQHLYDLGHRQIAFVRGPRRLSDSRLRWEGVRAFARNAGLRLDPKLIRYIPDTMDSTSSFEGSRQIVTDLIASGEKFTAILAFDDIAAYGSIRALSEGGRRVGVDCSVIGFDDIPAAAFSTPALTTVRQPMFEMGAYAAEYILQSLDGKDGAERPEIGGMNVLPVELIVRDSTVPVGGVGGNRLKVR